MNKRKRDEGALLERALHKKDRRVTGTTKAREQEERHREMEIESKKREGDVFHHNLEEGTCLATKGSCRRMLSHHGR